MIHAAERAFATRTVHHPQVVPTLAPVATPIYQTSTYRSESTAELAEFAAACQPTSFYTRYGNPTVEVLERVVADLEGGQCGLAFSSGMAAVSCMLLGLLQAGDHVVAGSSLYTATTLLLTEELPRMGVSVEFVDAVEPESFARAGHSHVLHRDALESDHAIDGLCPTSNSTLHGTSSIIFHLISRLHGIEVFGRKMRARCAHPASFNRDPAGSAGGRSDVTSAVRTLPAGSRLNDLVAARSR